MVQCGKTETLEGEEEEDVHITFKKKILACACNNCGYNRLPVAKKESETSQHRFLYKPQQLNEGLFPAAPD